MADDVHVRVLHGLDESLGHVLFEPAVDRGHNHVQLCEDVVRKIQRTVRQNVDLDACVNAETIQFLVESANLLYLCQKIVDLLAAGVLGGTRVIANPQVNVAELAGGLRHLLDRGHSVAVFGVDVQVASNVADFHQAWEAVFRSGLNFAPVFAKFGGDPVHPHHVVDFFLVFAPEAFVVLNVEDAVLADFETVALGDVPQMDVVRLRAGEVLES